MGPAEPDKDGCGSIWYILVTNQHYFKGCYINSFLALLTNMLALTHIVRGYIIQGFSGMNRFNTSTWSKVQCEMILAFLSFADYFRPKYFLLENVRNFVSFNKGQTFRLTLASLLEMGYQVHFFISHSFFLTYQFVLYTSGKLGLV